MAKIYRQALDFSACIYCLRYVIRIDAGNNQAKKKFQKHINKFSKMAETNFRSNDRNKFQKQLHKHVSKTTAETNLRNNYIKKFPKQWQKQISKAIT